MEVRHSESDAIKGQVSADCLGSASYATVPKSTPAEASVREA